MKRELMQMFLENIKKLRLPLWVEIKLMSNILWLKIRYSKVYEETLKLKRVISVIKKIYLLYYLLKLIGDQRNYSLYQVLQGWNHTIVLYLYLIRINITRINIII